MFSNSVHQYTCTVYREIFAPILFSPLLSSLSEDKFKTGEIHIFLITLLIKKRIYDTSASGWIQDGAKLYTIV